MNFVSPAIHGIIFYLPAFKAYIYNALDEMLEDNVQHVQIRTSLPTICTKMKDLGCGPLTKYEAAKGAIHKPGGQFFGHFDSLPLCGPFY